MTAVGPYPINEFEFSDDHSLHTRSRPTSSCASSIAGKYVPPAVPSPPRSSNQYFPPEPPLPRKDHSLILDMSDNDFNQWIFTDAEIDSSPSILDGLSPAEERYRRTRGVAFISAVCNLLQIPQVTLSAASLLFHRFFMRKSMIQEKGGIHHYNVAATALFIAMKSEETIRHTKPFIFACVKVAQKNPRLEVDTTSKEYWRWRDSILMYEEVMLELLTFDLSTKSPLIYLNNFLEEIRVASINPALWKELRNYAWAFICDSNHSVLGLMVSPRTIALTALLFAATARKVEIPQINGKDWWEHLGGKEDQIVKAGVFMHAFLSDSPFQGSESSPPASMATKYLHRSSGKDEKNGMDSTDSQMEDVQATQNGNGHVQANVTNGTENTSQQTSESQTHTKEESDASAEKLDSIQTSHTVSGTDDTALKAAANSLSTHVRNGPEEEANGTSETTPADVKLSPKRKAEEEIKAEELEAKKPKLDESQSQNTIQNDEEKPKQEAEAASAPPEIEAGTGEEGGVIEVEQ
ncbi:cyclin-K protein [Rutstroemia sp. NJR-2017a BVV2]|nr:cyclin-K protein [Rutstroemia sp. NJR-2017a BVV2]